MCEVFASGNSLLGRLSTTDFADYTDGEGGLATEIADHRDWRAEGRNAVLLRIRRQVAGEDGLVARSTHSIRVFRAFRG